MKKSIVAILILLLIGCSGGGGTQSESYAGLTTEDFAGKTIYYVFTPRPVGITYQQDGIYSYRFVEGGTLILGFLDSQQTFLLNWEVKDGQLHIWQKDDPYIVTEKPHTIFTLIEDNQNASIFVLKVVLFDTTSFTVRMFYNQVTGKEKAVEYFLSQNK